MERNNVILLPANVLCIISIPVVHQEIRESGSRKQIIGLNILDLINYRVNGGIEPKIKLIVNGWFSVFNTSKKCRELINEENHRFRESISFLNDFLCADISSDQRWDVVENYFLGKMDTAKALLDGNTSQQAATSDDDT